MSAELRNLTTPCLVLDLAALERNLARVRDIVAGAGIDLRPHCKTGKSHEVARRATTGFSGAITVATLNEAEYFAEHGFTDITYAVGFVPAKLDRVRALQDRGVVLRVITDDAGVADALCSQCTDASQPLPVLIEIEAGAGRTGVLPDSPALLAIAKRLDACDGIALCGVLGFGGAGYGGKTSDDIARIAEEERAALSEAAGRIRGEGISCPIVSAGSTPNVLCARSFEGLTEVRPGVYVFGDLMMHALGLYAYQDIAVTIHATVIGHNRDKNRIYIDAGALALSKDHGIERRDIPYAKYGLVRQHESAEPYPGIGVLDVNQEHGFVGTLDSGDEFPFSEFPVGSMVRVMPNHVCHSIATYDRYYVVDVNDGVVSTWGRTVGW